MRRGTVVLFFLLSAGLVFRASGEGFITTDTAGGIFKSDRKLSFSLDGPGTLRLLLDSREIYRGEGPAFPELGVPRGEERGFTLNAEYYSPTEELLESRSWYIYIDKKPPSLPRPEFRNSPEGPRLKSGREKQDVKIRALADIGETLVFFPDIDNAALPPSDSFPALIWAEDLAGNYSKPKAEFFELSLVKIENPIPGEWLNRQTLVISGAEGKEVYWSADGSDPFESGGALYEGPARIEKDGEITVRVGWKDSSGRVMEDRVTCTVKENGEGAAPLLEHFRLAEGQEIDSVTSLSVPSSWFWSMGESVPCFRDVGSINLRPEPLVKRAAAIHLSPSSGSPGSAVYRFVYLLNGGGAGTKNESLPPEISLEETSLYPAAEAPADSASSGNTFPPLTLVSADRNRLVVWPEVKGDVFYSFGGLWQKAAAPLPVPPEGGTLRFFVLEGEDNETTALGEVTGEGPFSVEFEPAPERKTGAARGRIAVRKHNESREQHWDYVSDVLPYTSALTERVPGACDGEDLDWAFIGTDGKILGEKRADRLFPPAPLFSGAPENLWSRGPVTLSAVSGEKDSVCFLNARLIYASGAVELLSGRNSLEIDSTLDEIAEVTVEGFREDAAGNRGMKTRVQFTLDPKTVYVSKEALVAGAVPAGEKGGMDNPFSSLDEALAFADKGSLSEIRIAGTVVMEKPVTVRGKLRIDGGWRKAAQSSQGENKDAGAEESAAALVIAESCNWTLESGASLSLSGLAIERKSGEGPLFHAAENAALEISGAEIKLSGAFLRTEGSLCEIRNSAISVAAAGNYRQPAVSAAGSTIRIYDSSLKTEAAYCLLFDLAGGNLFAGNSVFRAEGQTAALFRLDNTAADFKNSELYAAGVNYASAMEAADSKIAVMGGKLDVSARDAAALLLDESPAAVIDTQVRIAGSFSARAADIKGSFPFFQNCFFLSEGTAEISEIFSGPGELSLPTGNRFSGFTHVRAGKPFEGAP